MAPAASPVKAAGEEAGPRGSGGEPASAAAQEAIGRYKETFRRRRQEEQRTLWTRLARCARARTLAAPAPPQPAGARPASRRPLTPSRPVPPPQLGAAAVVPV